MDLALFVDDVVILLRGKDTALSWAQPRGLNVNPAMTEICLFTRKMKFPKYNELCFLGKKIPVTEIFLDLKLKCRHHIGTKMGP